MAQEDAKREHGMLLFAFVGNLLILYLFFLSGPMLCRWSTSRGLLYVDPEFLPYLLLGRPEVFVRASLGQPKEVSTDPQTGGRCLHFFLFYQFEDRVGPFPLPWSEGDHLFTCDVYVTIGRDGFCRKVRWFVD